MNKLQSWAFIPIILLVFLATDSAKSQVPDLPREFNKMAWIVGDWRSPGTEIVVSEYWEREVSDRYRFRSVMLMGSDTLFNERGGISEKNGVISLTTTIAPDGKQPVLATYRMIKNNGKQLVFENKSIVIQSRITYKKMGADMIELSLSGSEEGKPAKEVYRLKRVL